VHPALEVLGAFGRLGVSAFGGPIAHIGYFRAEFVERRKWLEQAAFAEIVALCNLLPGPSSSQVGMIVGYVRAGWLGLFAAWIAFTLPPRSSCTPSPCGSLQGPSIPRTVGRTDCS